MFASVKGAHIGLSSMILWTLLVRIADIEAESVCIVDATSQHESHL